MLKNKFYDEKNLLFLRHSIDELYKALNKQFSENKIKKFLKEQREYTLFKQPNGRKRNRNHYRVFSIDQCWEMDLISFPSLAQYNSNFVHALVCIDIYIQSLCICSTFVLETTIRNKN